MKATPQVSSTRLTVLTLFATACIWADLSVTSGAEDTSSSPKIIWFDITQASPPSKIAELRAKILTLIEPVKRQVFGNPQAVVITGHFLNFSPQALSLGMIPQALSTNVDGTAATVLSPAQLKALRQRLKSTPEITEIASPTVMSTEGTQAKLSVMKAAKINGTNAPYGQMLDILPHVEKNGVLLRAIAEHTVLITNTPPTRSMEVTTAFQSALETTVPNGGALAVWNVKPQKAGSGYLLLVCPTIQTNFPGKPAGFRPAAPPPAKK